MIAAAGMAGDALDGGGQIAITVRDHGGELVDLVGRFRRRLDFDPAPDAVENAGGIEGIGGGGCHRCVAVLGRQSTIVIPGRAPAPRPQSAASMAPRFRVRPFYARPGMTACIQRLSGASRAAICSTRSTMLRRSLASSMRVNARVSARPSEVARKSET